MVSRLKRTKHLELSGHDGTKLLDDSKAATFRSILGALLYISHERADIQYCTKSLASYLKSPGPTDQSWNALGRLLGYLNATQHFATVLSKTSPGTSPFQRLNGGVDDGASKMKSLVWKHSLMQIGKGAES